MTQPGALATELGLGDEWQRAFAEVERLVGGSVVAAERQARWRPAFFLDVDVSGEVKKVYFRGDRGLATPGVYALEHELAVLELLEAEGILVPHVYGFCEEPRGIVMEQSPGRANLATAESDEERHAVLDHYMEILAAVHRIPEERFATLGLPSPQGSHELGLGDLPQWEKSWRDARTEPDPLIEFALGWLQRNVPEGRSRACLITSDAGQLLFDAGRVTAMVDLELACLGDPLSDLGGMRCRDLSEPLGDLSRAFRTYASVTGEAVDRRAVEYHTARFGLITPLAVQPLCSQAAPGLNLPQYEGWRIAYGQIPLECIAALEGVALDPPDLPEPAPSRYAPALRVLRRDLGEEKPFDERSYEDDTQLRLAQWASEIEWRSRELEAQDLEEAAKLLGSRPADWRACDAALEQLVAAAGPERDAELVRFFHRRTLRQRALLAPAMRELEHAGLQPIDWAP